MKVSILGVSKAKVLMALYNASKMQGNSFLGGDGSPMTIEQAEAHIKEELHFDYLNGKVMKVDLSKDVVDVWLYDRDNGEGSALMAICKVCPEAHVVAEEIKKEEPKEEKVVEVEEPYFEDVVKVKKKKKSKFVKIEYGKGFFKINGEKRTVK